jgi:hypothetical protein
MKENVRAMREMQLKHREEKEEAINRPEKELYKLPQFQQVQSRVFEDANLSMDSARGHEGGQFLQRGTSERRLLERASQGRAKRAEVEERIREAARVAAVPPSPRKPSVPRIEDLSEAAPTRNDKNFIRENKVRALQAQPRLPPQPPSPRGELHRDFGHVPRYLEDRKAQKMQEEAERRRNAPDPNCPPGMVAMPDEERRSTLATLQASRQECIHQLERMPFVIETPSMKQKQKNLELKIREIDNAITLFSRPKVYVTA